MKFILLVSFLLFLLLTSCNNSNFKNDLSSILGVNNVEVESTQTLEEWGGAQGDGFMLETFELSEKTSKSFLKKASKILPNKKEVGKNWKKHDWEKIPIDSSFREVFTICLNYSSDNDKIKNQLSQLKKLIRSNGIYCSFYYRPGKYNPQNVQLFIFDVKNRKLYCIDQQI